MRVKNLVLLGFILQAISYLSKETEQEDNDKLLYDELGAVDLKRVKEELGEKLVKAAGEFGGVIDSLTKIGADAFEKFIAEEGDGKLPVINKLKDVVTEEKAEKKEAFDFNHFIANLSDDFDQIMDELQHEELPKLVKHQEAVQEEAKEEADTSLWHELDDDEEALSKTIDELLKEEKETPTPAEAQEEKPTEKSLGEMFEDLWEVEDEEDEPHTEDAHKEPSRDEIDELFQEIVDQEDKGVLESEKQQYMDQLLDELPKEEKPYVPDIYDQINELYPYLSKSFVRSVYDLKGSIAKEYPYDKNVITLHRVRFKNVDDLRQFVEIVTNHDYTVNVDEKQMIVDLFKLYRNTDGKILTNIFEIANQAKLLHGEYEGYRVEVRE